MRSITRALIAATAALAMLVPSAALAADDGGGAAEAAALSDPVVTGLAGPLQIAVNDGTIFIAQSFAGLLTILDEGDREDLPFPGIDGIDVGNGSVVFSTRADGEPTDPGFFATLERLRRDGTTTRIADIWAYEQSANPDQVNTYGFVSISDDCAAQLPPELGPPQYTGQPDSNPFGVLAVNGKTYVADAGANALLEVSRSGRVRTVAVLPPQPSTITADAATELGLPPCTIGLTYGFEPVPTDVELGRNGRLYVTTLPGGPESPALGARGSVLEINPRTGSIRQIATGFLGATNLAIGPRGTIYVTEIFGNRVSRVGRDGTPEPVVDLATPSGLEYSDGKLYVSYNVFADGAVATIDLTR